MGQNLGQSEVCQSLHFLFLPAFIPLFFHLTIVTCITKNNQTYNETIKQLKTNVHILVSFYTVFVRAGKKSHASDCNKRLIILHSTS
jgi:hypothetical protein